MADNVVWNEQLGMYTDEYGNALPWLTPADPIVKREETSDTTVVTTGGGGGGGGGWGGGGGGGGAIDYTDSDVRIQLANEYDLWMGDGWAASHPEVIEYAFVRSWGSDAIRMDCVDRGANSVWANSVWAYIRSKVGDVSASVVQSLMRSGAYIDKANFEAYIAPQYSGSSVLTNRQSDEYVDLWDQYTAGKAMTWTAEQKLQEIANTYGYTPEGKDAWERWLRTTESANAGNYGAAKRQVIRDVFTSIMNRAPTDEELAQNSQWMDLVSGAYGEFDTAAFVEQLRETEEYQALYEYKPATMSEQEWWDKKAEFNAVGSWYFNDQAFAGVGFEYTDQEIAQLIAEGWEGTSLARYYQAVEEAAYDKAVYSPILEETLGYSFTDDEWFALANGGQGSGNLRAQLVEAQSKNEFREAYRQVFGNDPSPNDYDRITSQYVSPSELIRETQAKNSAAEMYPEVSDLLKRVFGMSISESELADMAIGRAGTGDLRALINEAEKLDQYRWVHKQYYGEEPTAADYAKYAGYSGPDELQWEIVTNERIGEYSDVIKDDFLKGLGMQISDEDIRIMLGEQEGYGELQGQWTKAKKEAQKKENAEQAAHDAEKVNIAYQADETGGFRASLPGLATL